MHAFEKTRRKIISKVFFKFCSSSYYYRYIITNNYVPIFCPILTRNQYIFGYFKDTHLGRRSGGLTGGMRETDSPVTFFLIFYENFDL